MIKGFSLVEVLVVSALTFVLISMIVSNITVTNRCSQKVIGKQLRMEAIFHTVDTIRSDLSNCGKRLREASAIFGFTTFENTDQSFRVLFGVGEEMLLDDCWLEETAINVNRNDYFSKGKEILIYDREHRCFEFNEIRGRSGDWLLLSNELQNNYSRNSMVVALKEVEYRIYEKENVLKRKVNGGYFQPLIEDVTAFDVTYFPEADSVLYMLEVNRKEQVYGYIFLANQVEK